MGDLWISDISHFDLPDGSLPTGKSIGKIRFLGQIVSAASLMAPGEFQTSAVQCRRRPKRQRCTGKIRLGHEAETGDIHWICTQCGDKGVITNWKETRWDLSPELKKGHIVSLSEERARRAGKTIAPMPLKVFVLDVDLIYAPIGLDEQVGRRIRLSSDQSLHDLHLAIHDAFDRVEDEAYEFMFGAPYDPHTKRFIGCNHNLEDDENRETNEICLGTLGLNVGDSFGYLFDFSDEWVHRLTVRSVKDIVGQSQTPQVISRQGESPPQLPVVDEPWDDDLFWNDVETTYPLTGLYGPYLADEGVDNEEWLSLDDLEQHLLVMEAHTHSLPVDHVPIESLILHAVVHVLAETYLAELDEGKAESILKHFSAGTTSRHQSIHNLGEDRVHKLLSSTPFPPPPKNGNNRKGRTKNTC